jgi:hypothetical protein
MYTTTQNKKNNKYIKEPAPTKLKPIKKFKFFFNKFCLYKIKEFKKIQKIKTKLYSNFSFKQKKLKFISPSTKNIKILITNLNQNHTYTFRFTNTNIDSNIIQYENNTTKSINLIYLFFYLFKKQYSITQYLYLNIKLNWYLKLIIKYYFEINTNFLKFNKINFLKSFILYKQNLFKKNLNKILFLPLGYTTVLTIINVNILKNLIYFYNTNKLKFNLQIFFFTLNTYFLFLNYNKNFNKENNWIKFIDVINHKFILSFLSKRKNNKINNLLVNYFSTHLIIKKFSKKSIWKTSFLKVKTKKHVLPIKFNYIVHRIEEHIDFLEQTQPNSNRLKKIINLRHLLYAFWKKKLNFLKGTKSILTNAEDIVDFKVLYFKNMLRIFIEEELLEDKQSYIYTLTSLRKINTSKKIILKNKWKKPLSYISNLKDMRILFQNQYYNYTNNKELISLFFGFPINLYYINALALTRFEYHHHIKMHKKYAVLNKKKSSELFIFKLEREFLKKYKFIANYLQDFARIGFLSLYTKNLSFLMKFIAFQIAKLQKNRKETKLIRFIIKALKIFSAQRREILGLKVQFKGRVNRWRRTKIITGTRGYIPFYSYKTRLEYATATSITRKGALGIRFWLYYTLIYNKELEYSLLRYLYYTKLFAHKKKQKSIKIKQK